MIQLIDEVDCDGLQKSVVKPEALKKAVLVQDAQRKEDHLFALLMVDARRTVLVRPGTMSLNSAVCVLAGRAFACPVRLRPLPAPRSTR